MRIGIVETDHFEVSYTTIRLFDNGENEITVFTYEKSYRQFEYLFGKDLDKYHWIVKEENTSELNFIKNIYRDLQKKKFPYFI